MDCKYTTFSETGLKFYKISCHPGKYPLEDVCQCDNQVGRQDEELPAAIGNTSASRAVVGRIDVISGPQAEAEIQIQMRGKHVGIAASDSGPEAVALRSLGRDQAAAVVFLIPDFGGKPPPGIYVPGPVACPRAERPLAAPYLLLPGTEGERIVAQARVQARRRAPPP